MQQEQKYTTVQITEERRARAEWLQFQYQASEERPILLREMIDRMLEIGDNALTAMIQNGAKEVPPCN